MKKDWTKPKLISLYRGRSQEAVLRACKLENLAVGPGSLPDGAAPGDPLIGDCETGSGNQCYDIDLSAAS